MLYNIPTVESLRILEIAAGLALLFAPEKVEVLREQLGERIPSVHEVSGLGAILG